MNTSKVAVCHAQNHPFSIEEVAIPPLGRGEILVRNEYTTLCRSDINTFTGKRQEKMPTILGHEVVGRIEAMDADVPASDCRGKPLRVGDRLTWAIYAADPGSELALMGIPQKGEGLFKYGHEPITPDSHLHGGLGEYCILRRHTPVIRIDTPIPLPLIALINCSVATVAGSLRLAGAIEGRNILVTGAGMLGVIACAMCRAGGADQILAVDIDSDRLQTVRRFGADSTVQVGDGNGSVEESIRDIMGGKPIHVALDYSGVPESMESSLAVLGIGGIAVWVGATFPQRALSVNAEKVVRNLHTIRGLHNYNEDDLIRAVGFMESHYEAFPFLDLVDGGFGLDQVNEAFECAIKSGAHRVGVKIGGSSCH